MSVSGHPAHLYLYDGPNLDGWYYEFVFSEAQRCYSIPCFSDRTHSLKYRLLPQNGHLVLYEDAECKGRHYKLLATPHGKLRYKLGGFDLGLSSFMVWSTGTFATEGLVDLACKEMLANASANSSVVGD